MKVHGPNRKERDSLKRRDRRELYVFGHQKKKYKLFMAKYDLISISYKCVQF